MFPTWDITPMKVTEFSPQVEIPLGLGSALQLFHPQRSDPEGPQAGVLEEAPQGYPLVGEDTCGTVVPSFINRGLLRKRGITVL